MATAALLKLARAVGVVLMTALLVGWPAVVGAQQCGSAVMGETAEPAVIQGLGPAAVVRLWALGEASEAWIPDPCSPGCARLESSPLCDGNGDCLAVTGIEWLNGTCPSAGYLPAAVVLLAEGATTDDGGRWAAVQVDHNPADANFDLDAAADRICGGCSSEASPYLGGARHIDAIVSGAGTVTLDLTWDAPSAAAEALNEEGPTVVTGYSVWVARSTDGLAPAMTGDPAGWTRLDDTDGTHVGGHSTDTQATVELDLEGSDEAVYVAIGLAVDGTGDAASDADCMGSTYISRASFAHDPLGEGPEAVVEGPITVCDQTPVQFGESSTNADTWAWDFEDDGSTDSTARVPAPIVYPGPGAYVCRLTVTNGGGTNADQETHLVRVIGLTSAVPGDADADGTLDATDLAAAIAELADGDGAAVGDRCAGFATADAVDTNGDDEIHTGDLVTAVELLF